MLGKFGRLGTGRRGFTLIEMLVVIGIIAILTGAAIGSFSAMTKTAEKAKAQELVSNVATALTALFQQEGAWPKRLISNNNKQLDKDAAVPLAKGGYFSLTTKGSGSDMQLSGLDKFGILSPWATAIVKRRGTSAQLADKVNGTSTVKDHILYYALDLDGDGIIKGANVGGKTIDIRATAAVWCGGKDGVVDPYPFAGGGEKRGGHSSRGQRSDDQYSWTPGQTKDVE